LRFALVLAFFLVPLSLFALPPQDQIEQVAHLVQSNNYEAARSIISQWEYKDQVQVLDSFFTPRTEGQQRKAGEIKSQFWFSVGDNPGSGAKILAALLNPTDRNLTKSTTKALTQTSQWSSKISPVLRSAINNIPSLSMVPIERQRVIEFIAINGDPSLIPAFHRVRADTDPIVKTAAKFYLERLPILAASVDPKLTIDVRREAAILIRENLSEIPSAFELLKALIPQSVASNDTSFRTNVVRALADLPRAQGPESSALEPMRSDLEALMNFSQRFGGDLAARFVKQWGGDTHISFMVELARHSSVPAVQEAAWNQLSSQPALAAVMGKGKPDSPETRRAALGTLAEAVRSGQVQDGPVFDRPAGDLPTLIQESLNEGNLVQAITFIKELPSGAARETVLKAFFKERRRGTSANRFPNRGVFWDLSKKVPADAVRLLGYLLDPDSGLRDQTIAALKGERTWAVLLDLALGRGGSVVEAHDRVALGRVLNLAAESGDLVFTDTFMDFSRGGDPVARGAALEFFGHKKMLNRASTRLILAENLSVDRNGCQIEAVNFVRRHARDFQVPYEWADLLVHSNATDPALFAAAVEALEAFPRESLPASEQLTNEFRNGLSEFFDRLARLGGLANEYSLGGRLIERWGRDLPLNWLIEMAQTGPPEMADAAWEAVQRNRRAKTLLAEADAPQGSRAEQVDYLAKKVRVAELADRQRDRHRDSSVQCGPNTETLDSRPRQ
jgi:hypothetical protein